MRAATWPDESSNPDGDGLAFALSCLGGAAGSGAAFFCSTRSPAVTMGGSAGLSGGAEGTNPACSDAPAPEREREPEPAAPEPEEAQVKAPPPPEPVVSGDGRG